MKKIINGKIVAWILVFAMSTLQAESTEDTLQRLPPPTKRSSWKACAFAGSALLAVAGGIFAICWSGGGKTPKDCHKDCHNRSKCKTDICPNTITADCMSGSCIYHHSDQKSNNCGCLHGPNDCSNSSCRSPCELYFNPPPCCALNGGVPPF